NNVVLEVLPSVEVDEDVTTALERLKKMGYKIALDDYSVNDPRESLVDYADFLKVDLKRTSLEEAEKLAARRGYICKMVAQKVETREDYTVAKRAGYHLFQGYFFRRPQMVRTWSGSSPQVSSLNLLREVSRAELDWDAVEKEIKCDATLCYRLLRYLNSPFFGFRSEIRTVRQALMILGETEVRRWCRLAVTVDMTRNKPSDLLLAALTRARLSELLGERLAYADSDLFLLGLLSLMDAILEIPMQRALDALHVHHDLKSALLDEESDLTPVYRLVVAVEAGAWDEAARWCESMGLTESYVAETLWRAMEWAHDVSTPGMAA
ncbi:MAG TPA: HDOD domain-containing protein, partial [Terracidiphilus sp.]|nr:HDOD domain-containing protein [Terracidiphilus sp.]